VGRPPYASLWLGDRLYADGVLQATEAEEAVAYGAGDPVVGFRGQ
jgi:hypothetical protein